MNDRSTFLSANLAIVFNRLQVDFDRQKAIRISGLSEKAYIRSLTNLQNALGLR